LSDFPLRSFTQNDEACLKPSARALPSENPGFEYKGFGAKSGLATLFYRVIFANSEA